MVCRLHSPFPLRLLIHLFRSKWEKREVGRIGTRLRHEKKVIHFFFSRLDLCAYECVVENVTKGPHSDF